MSGVYIWFCKYTASATGSSLWFISSTKWLTFLWQEVNLHDPVSQLFELPFHGSHLLRQSITFYGSFPPAEILKFDLVILSCFYWKERMTVVGPFSDWLTNPFHHFLRETWKIIILSDHMN
jgi:hypothetical protein